MQGTLMIFRPDKLYPEIRTVEKAPDLDMLKDGIGGGYIEVVPYFSTIEHNGQIYRCIAFADEDGKRKNLDLNAHATALWNRAMRKAVGCGCAPDYLVGQILVVFGDEEWMGSL